MEKDDLLYVFLKEEKDVEFHYEGGKAYPVDSFVIYKWMDEYLGWVNAKFLPIKIESNSFKEACLPLIKYLCENHHPHVKVIVTPIGAELLEGLKSTGEIMNFVRD